jgi:hypothetical protein
MQAYSFKNLQPVMCNLLLSTPKLHYSVQFSNPQSLAQTGHTVSAVYLV